MNAASDVAAAPAPTRLPAILRKRLRSTSSRARRSTMPGVGSPASVLLDSVIRTPCLIVRKSGPTHPSTAPAGGRITAIRCAGRRPAHDLCPRFGRNPARLRTDPWSAWHRGQTFSRHSAVARRRGVKGVGDAADAPHSRTGAPVQTPHALTPQLPDRDPARSLRPPARHAAALARGLRAQAGAGQAPGRARPRRRGGLADASAGARSAHRPPAARRGRPAAGPDRRVGRRPLLVAGPDGAVRPAARRAHDAGLAQLVCHVGRGRHRGPDAAPEPDDARSGAGQLPRPAGRGHA